MPDIEPLQQDTAHLDSAHPEQVAATRVTTVGSSPIMDRAPKGRGEERGKPQQQEQPQQQSQSHQPSMMKLVLVTAAVSLICGVIGAVGYTHFFAPASGDGIVIPVPDASRLEQRIEVQPRRQGACRKTHGATRLRRGER